MDGTIESPSTDSFARPLKVEIATYEANRVMLERDYPGQWVVIKNTEIVGHYATIDEAAQEGLRRFGGTQFLLRQVCAPTQIVLPASAVYARMHA
jgi:hypothetical protein